VNKPDDGYDFYRAVARSGRWRLTPYRLGLYVGAAGADLPGPYTNAVVAATFRGGVQVGRRNPGGFVDDILWYELRSGVWETK
jgi:hypothetical protein